MLDVTHLAKDHPNELLDVSTDIPRPTSSDSRIFRDCELQEQPEC
jgi:hypothetical protein